MTRSKTPKTRATKAPKASTRGGPPAPSTTTPPAGKGTRKASAGLPAKVNGTPSKAQTAHPEAAPATPARTIDNGAAVVLKIGAKIAREVADIEGAQIEYVHLRDASKKGSANFDEGQVYVGGTHCATIRYNGRVYDTTGFLMREAPEATAAREVKVDELPEESCVHLESKYLHAALAVAGKKDVRHYLNGVFIHQVEGELRFVASDGHRMLVIGRPCTEKLPWGKDGLILPREQLERVARYLGNKSGTMFTLGYGVGRPKASIIEFGGIARFEIAPIEATFVPYQRIVEQAGQVLTAQREPADTSAVKAEYLKSAGVIGGILECDAVFPFVGATDRDPCVFTFSKEPGALFVVMPMAAGMQAIRGEAIRMIGAAGMAATLTALKAHETRTKKALAEAKEPRERELLEARLKSYHERIDAIRVSTTPALPPAEAQDEQAPPLPAARKRGGGRRRKPETARA